MRIKPASYRVSIVLVGTFSPAMFQPAWFALNKMLGKKEAESAKVGVVHPDITDFSVEQFRVQAQPNKFAIFSLGPHPEHVRDLVISCFGNVVPATPIHAFGINSDVHFDTGSFAIRDEVGRRLAPRDVWGEWGREIESSPMETGSRAGVRSLTMHQPKRTDGLSGAIQVKIEPSGELVESGIYMQVNDHLEVGDANKVAANGTGAVALIEKYWETSLKKSSIIIDQIMALAETCRK